MDVKLMVIILLIPLHVNSECSQGIARCQWEPWAHWSPCTRTCAGLRTRTRNMCCGNHIPDCIESCRRPNTSVETEPCQTHCPNGGSYIDGYCHCPPLRYGICCEDNETNVNYCARPCTWFNWFSWGSCNTDCGCGRRTRRRSVCCQPHLNSSQCAEDCNMYDDTEERTCTAACPSDSTPCKLCTWNDWHAWTSCSKECGGGQRSRSRTPCCCEGHSNDEDCLYDCGLPVNDTEEMSSCREICYNEGRFVNGTCECPSGFDGNCCHKELLERNCTKCTLQTWNPWGPCSQTCGEGHRTRTRYPCCRAGQDIDECTTQCSLDEDIFTEMGDCAEACCGPELEMYMFTGAGSVVGTLLVTAFIWCICKWLQRKHTTPKSIYDSPSFAEAARGNQGPHYANTSYEGNTGVSEEEPYDKLY